MKKMRHAIGLLVLGAALVTVPGLASAVQLVQVVSGLSSPVFVTSARDGTNRLFIVEQTGMIKVLQPGSTTPTVFLNITGRVTPPNGGEQGLLGLAFHPNYSQNRRFFVNYTRKTDGATVIGEFKASATDPNVAPNKQRRILVIKQPFANHNGGMLAFGPDGKLYIGMGDGGSANDPGDRAQNLDSRLGKILRIEVTASGNPKFVNPADNPFVGLPGNDSIWAYGFRNPWRWSFDRLTGELWGGDVGQGAKEEVDIVVRGGNYGWRVHEGTLCTNNDPAKCDDGGFIGPIDEYDNAGSPRCAITGGYVYRGTGGTFPAGTYIYADYCSGEIFKLADRNADRETLMDTAMNISSFGEREDGEILVVDLNGAIHRLAP